MISLIEKINSPQPCPLDGVIDVISRKWSLLVINALGNCKKIRFNELLEQLQIVSPKTLSETLKKLSKEKLVIRKAFAEIPPRVEYSLTEQGVGLWKAIIPLLNWTAKRGNSSGRECSLKTCKLPEEQKIKILRDKI